MQVVERAARAPRLIAATLVPLTPRPIVAVATPPTPTFITQGDYRSCITGGRSLLTVPSDNWQPLLWTASLTDEVAIATSKAPPSSGTTTGSPVLIASATPRPKVSYGQV